MARAATYRLRVEGQLGPEWSDWFAGLTVDSEPEGTTVLSGRLPDQAALHGLLGMIRDLGLSLMSLDTIADPQGPADEGA